MGKIEPASVCDFVKSGVSRHMLPQVGCLAGQFCIYYGPFFTA